MHYLTKKSVLVTALQSLVAAFGLWALLAFSGTAYGGSFSDPYAPGGSQNYSAPAPLSGYGEDRPSKAPSDPYTKPAYQRSPLEQRQLDQDRSRYGEQDYRRSPTEQRQHETDRQRYGR